MDSVSIVAGALLWHAGEKAANPVKAAKFVGYGKGMIIQASFLLVMDIISYISQSKNAARFYGWLEKVIIRPDGAGIRVFF